MRRDYTEQCEVRVIQGVINSQTPGAGVYVGGRRSRGGGSVAATTPASTPTGA